MEIFARLGLNFDDKGVGQGYDNGANMSGKYNGVQAVLKEEKKNQNCVLSSCGNHTLNLVGTDCAGSNQGSSDLFWDDPENVRYL